MVTVIRMLELRHYEDQCREEKVKIEREVVTQPVAGAGATKPGDARRMRGVPIIGEGVPGASPGSRPGENLGLLDDNDWSDLTPAIRNPEFAHRAWTVEQWHRYHEGEDSR